MSTRVRSPEWKTDTGQVRKSLLLNASFEPHCVVSWQRAVVLTIFELAEAAEYDTERYEVQSVSCVVEVPRVLRLARYVNMHKSRGSGPPSKGLVLSRDNFLCQYCNMKATTVDHVNPRANGGVTEWTNVVACCYNCNQFKADRLCSDIGWDTPTPMPPEQVLIRPEHESWEKWLNFSKIK